MKNFPDCNECRSILDDFMNSLGEVEQLRDELGTNTLNDAARRWLEGEDGADFLEALHNLLHGQPFASRFTNPRCPGFARAMQRMLAHYQRSDHWTSVRDLLTGP